MNDAHPEGEDNEVINIKSKVINQQSNSNANSKMMKRLKEATQKNLHGIQVSGNSQTD